VRRLAGGPGANVEAAFSPDGSSSNLLTLWRLECQPVFSRGREMIRHHATATGEY
jgi:hypothetical protein